MRRISLLAGIALALATSADAPVPSTDPLQDDWRVEQFEPLAIAKIDRRGFAKWQAPALDVASPDQPLKFVLRAYGDDGLFDETAPQALWLTPNGADNPGESSNAEDSALLAGYGESDPTAQNISVGSTGSR